MREKTTKIAVRAVKAYISKSILPTYVMFLRGRSHVYIFVPDPQMHGPHGSTCKRTDGHTDGRTDTQKHGQTRRWADGHAEARTQTQTHGCRRKRPNVKYSCVQCVGGKIVQTQDASGRTRKDLQDVLYIERFIVEEKKHNICTSC